MPVEPKLTKKQLKSKNFRNLTKNITEETQTSTPAATTTTNADGTEVVAKKKRKTRRGRKGKPRANGGNRFLVFVGSLPKGITQTELQAHFKSSNPNLIRIRPDKNIAFLEFIPSDNNDLTNIQTRIDKALLQNKTLIREKRINVELTVGGGGNSENRLQKLQKKNEKLDEERNTRMKTLMSKSNKPASTESTSTSTATPAAAGSSTIHPDRARLLK